MGSKWRYRHSGIRMTHALSMKKQKSSVGWIMKKNEKLFSKFIPDKGSKADTGYKVLKNSFASFLCLTFYQVTCGLALKFVTILKWGRVPGRSKKDCTTNYDEQS